ncbi:MAG TPA: phosphoribosylformylglycinamidine synthase subunit PurQ [Terracidiphilus sp.]|nr:phosphoribosylformylglycinamidine synthase subunit PurQ [Terracidiphilus sp.]
MKFGVLVFPGSNCDHDTYHVVETIAQHPVTYLWHASEDLQGCDAILVPGGFAYGDYLRTGAIARFAPVMQAVSRFAKNGGLVMGICNGFQILCEAGLLPGALMRNASQNYICKQTWLRTETTDSPFTHGLSKGQVLQMPIGHMEGNYFCDADTLATLKQQDRIAFRYATADGEVTAAANPNGSLENIAGVLSEGRNVLGMMPHPDRSSETLLGSADGLLLFQSMAQSLAATQ